MPAYFNQTFNNKDRIRHACWVLYEGFTFVANHSLDSQNLP